MKPNLTSFAQRMLSCPFQWHDLNIHLKLSKVLTRNDKFLYFLFLVFLFSHGICSGQCLPNTIAFHGSQPIFNTACGNNSYQTIDGSAPSPMNGNQTFQWEYSLNGGPYTLITSTSVDLPKDDITELILVVNGNTTGNYAIRRTVNDDSPLCSDVSDPVYLYYAQNSGQTSGGSINPLNSVSCFTANG